MIFQRQRRFWAVSFAFGMATMFAAPEVWAASETVLYAFKGPPGDGEAPNGLLYSGGVLYGTTGFGGNGSCPSAPSGCGTVFSLTLGGMESVLYDFAQIQDGDGAQPNGSLIESNGSLFGTTTYGGLQSCVSSPPNPLGCGTLFNLTQLGTETILHSFRGDAGISGTQFHSRRERPDGAFVNGGLVKVGNAFYGTTVSGGDGRYCRNAPGCGTVFKVSVMGRETLLHSFGQGTDGRNPGAGLVWSHGSFYGTTTAGGVGGYGTVYKMTPDGLLTTLYSFQNRMDGSSPNNLISVNNRLYGTTRYGGSSNYGTVFEIDADGQFKTLHTFAGNDGVVPSSLLWANGALYGTTLYGGSTGGGVVFKITAKGIEEVVYAFKGVPSDGDGPLSMINVAGTFYGVTAGGSAYNGGTVFQLTP